MVMIIKSILVFVKCTSSVFRLCRYHISYLLIVILCFSNLDHVLAQEKIVSELWGENGENWNNTGRLPDFSFAGYHEGLKELPNCPVAKNIKTDYGALGDGITDDTEAFLKAISENPGVVYIPEGKYVITKILRISNSNFVFRGAGAEKTTLYFPKSLMDIEPIYVTPSSRFVTGKTFWYHGKGGHIWVEGSYGQEKIANVVEATERGATEIKLSKVENLKIGQYIEISQQDDNEKSLANYLYAGDPGDISKLNVKPWQVAKIVAIDDNTITLDRHLRIKLDLKWQPVLSSFNPTVSEVGIEDLTIEYPATDYKGHFYEENNGIYFGNITNSWIKNVTVLNADEGFLIHGRFCTLDGITVGGQRTPDSRGLQGHNGVLLDSGSGDNLVQNFSMDAVYMHMLSIRNTAGNVFSNGKGEDIDFDCAAHCPYANLFTNIDIGLGTNPWNGSGGSGSGKSSAAWNTFWNIQSDTEIDFPPAQFWSPQVTIVGCPSSSEAIKEKTGLWFEPINPKLLEPANIYGNQLSRRKLINGFKK